MHRIRLFDPLIAALILSPILHGQASPTFEVASIKSSKPDSLGQVKWERSQVFWTKATLKQVIMTAFGLKHYSYSGPAWLDSFEFDLVAKMPDGSEASQFSKMLQALLVERFKLVYHRESRSTNGYALVLTKEGLKIHPSEGGEMGGSAGPDRLRARHTSLAQLASMLSSSLNVPIQDMTGVSGVFDFDLKWVPDLSVPNVSSTSPPDAVLDSPGPSLFNVLQEQLGLKLEARKLPVEVLVVDRAERAPFEN
jgi:uncharacterized protein (TIGR03435 family)